MRVLQIVKTSVGASWAFDQARALSERGVEVITVMPDKEGRTYKKYEECGLPVIVADLSLPVSRPYKLFGRIKAFRRIVRETAPDLIHCHFVTNILMARIALRKDKTPRLFQVPGPLHLESGIFRRADLKTATAADRWMGACKYTVDIYRKSGIAPDRLFLGYYGGYGGKSCDEYKTENRTLHDGFGIADGERTVGMVSYIYKPKRYARQKRGIKGHEDFLDALHIVHKTHPEVVGVVIGGAWSGSEKYFEKIKRYASEHCDARVIFTGFRTDIKDIYCELDVVVHPSHSENLGGAAESLAAGRPTISTDVGGFPDIVIDGQTGRLCPKQDPESLAARILWILEHPEEANTMAAAGQEKVRTLLDIDACADAVKDAYCRILGETHE